MVDRGPLAEGPALTGPAHRGNFEIPIEYKYVNKMKALFIIDILMWMFLTGMVLIAILAIGEEIALKLPDSNKFKKWWRRNIISNFPYDSY